MAKLQKKNPKKSDETKYGIRKPAKKTYRPFRARPGDEVGKLFEAIESGALFDF